MYLSRAYHSGFGPGERGECPEPFDHPQWERELSEVVARAVANGPVSSLLDRHYSVRIGMGDFSDNVQRSNNWNADIHMPLHSNAVSPRPGCQNQQESNWGAREIFRAPGDGEALATEMKQKLDSYTPGTGDRTCVPSVCSQYDRLSELSDVDAPRAVYSETEFHIWNRGTRFLRDHEVWASSVGYALDDLLGYPR